MCAVFFVVNRGETIKMVLAKNTSKTPHIHMLADLCCFFSWLKQYFPLKPPTFCGGSLDNPGATAPALTRPWTKMPCSAPAPRSPEAVAKVVSMGKLLI